MTLTMERLNELGTERAQTAPDSFSVKPLAPDNITVTASKRGFRIQWSVVEGVEGYRVAVLESQDLSQVPVLKTIGGSRDLEYFYYVGNVAITRFFAVQSFNKDESSDFTELKNATTTIDVPNLLTSDFTTNSHTGDTDETTLVTFSMPASTMGTGDSLKIKAWGTMASSANNKTIKLVLGSTQFFSIANTTETVWTFEVVVANRNAANSQTFFYKFVVGGGTETYQVATMAEDTATALILKITGTLANGGDSVATSGWQVERLTGDTGEAEPPTPPNPPIEPPTREGGRGERDYGTF